MKKQQPRYNVYYMDNDRQKRIIVYNLLYHQAIKFMQDISYLYDADLFKELNN